MFKRSLALATRRAAFSAVPRRAFSAGVVRRAGGHGHGHEQKEVDLKANMRKSLEDIKDESDLMPPGANVGEVPSDIEQATGLERLEILGKMQGVDIFDMQPLPADRIGTVKDPIFVKSAGEEQYLGCTGVPSDSHIVHWITISRDRPLGRCSECGSCYMMEYVGPPDDPDHHHPDVDVHGNEYEEVKRFSDYVKPEYYYR